MVQTERTYGVCIASQTDNQTLDQLVQCGDLDGVTEEPNKTLAEKGTDSMLHVANQLVQCNFNRHHADKSTGTLGLSLSITLPAIPWEKKGHLKYSERKYLNIQWRQSIFQAVIIIMNSVPSRKYKSMVLSDRSMPSITINDHNQLEVEKLKQVIRLQCIERQALLKHSLSPVSSQPDITQQFMHNDKSSIKISKGGSSEKWKDMMTRKKIRKL